MEALPSPFLPLSRGEPRVEITISSEGCVLLRQVLGPGSYTIGSDAGCDLVVDLEGFSSQHAMISLPDAAIRLLEVENTIPTFVDRQRIVLGTKLHSGETMRFGNVAMLQIEHVADEDNDSDRHELEKLRGKVSFLTQARETLLRQLSTAAERLHGHCSPEEADYLRREVAELEESLTRTLDQRRNLEERCNAAEHAARRARATVAEKSVPVKRVAARRFVLVPAMVLTAGAFVLLLQNLQKAQERGRHAENIVAQLKPFADGFRDEALEYLARRFPADALGRISCAIGLDPGNADYHVIHGHICESILRISEARSAYARALEINPRHLVAWENLVLCDRILATRAAIPTEQSLYGLHRLMMKQARFSDALAMAARLAEDTQLLRDTWQAILDHAGLGGALKRLDDGTFDLNLSSGSSSSLAALAGMPLSTLDLSRSAITDLSPLTGLPLRVLDISRTRVRGLFALRGLPLQRLNLAETATIDLDPIAEASLEQLDISGTNVSDLSALAAMPLRSLRMAGIPVRDINSLAGVPLRELDATRTRITDIEALRSLPLETLRIDYTEVRDLTPLAGAPLRILSIAHTPVKDLGPLRGSGIRVLDLSGCRAIENLEPLAGCTTLERLIIPTQCRDVKILKTLRSLRFLSFEDGLQDFDQTAAEFWRRQGENEQLVQERLSGRLQSNSPSGNPGPSQP